MARRSSFMVSEETDKILTDFKKKVGAKRDRTIELSILYANKNKKDFIDFVFQDDVLEDENKILKEG